MTMYQHLKPNSERAEREPLPLLIHPGISRLLLSFSAIALLCPIFAAAQASPASPASNDIAPVQQPATGQGEAPPAIIPPSQPARPAAGASAVDNAKYIIGSEDTLQITVWREPTLSGILPVRPDGMISLVLVGDIKAEGRTPMQLGDDITQRLKKYIQDPSVTVAVTGVNSQRVYVVGEAGHVGPLTLSPGMTVLQAISTAGGPGPYANTKRIYILRGSGTTKQKIPFNYKKALKGDNQPGATLQPGDTIVIP